MLKSMEKVELIDFIEKPTQYKNKELLIKKFSKLKNKL
jgi:hypothetical protein